MKKLGLLFSLLPFCLSAAKAPDFTVTDYNNKTHNLYPDYLSKEKVVVLKIFFVDCPPCNTIAPLMETAYQRWGGGTGRVQFIEMSTMGFDNNSYVKSYAQKHGITFPGIGSDGGSLAAVAPYKDNKTFGTWYGTPTIAVIAPNGEVNYMSPFSSSKMVMLDTAIAQALRIPSNGGGGGGTKCTDSFQIQVFNQYSGKFTPKVVTFDLYNQGNPKYDILGGKYNCEFFFPAEKQNYVVGLDNIPAKGDDELSGISTQDLVILQKYILAIKPMNNLQIVLGDVNNNGVVSSSDISELRKLILGLIPVLKVGKYYGVANNPKGFDGKVSATAFVNDIISKKSSAEFGIGHYGDVSGAEKIGWLPGPQERTDCEMNITILTGRTAGGYLYALKANEDLSADGIQMGFGADFSGFRRLSLHPSLRDAEATGVNLIRESQGKLLVSWSDPSVDNIIKSGEPLLSFESSTPLELSIVGKQEIIMKDGSVCSLNFRTVDMESSFTNGWFTPSDLRLEVGPSVLAVNIYSGDGQLLCHKGMSAGSDVHNVSFARSNLPSGLLIVQTTTTDGRTILTRLIHSR